MIRFLHGYMEQDWDGLVLRGLVDDTSGVKFHQSAFHTPAPEISFNALACRGGKLHGIVSQADGRPFYIDRLQGGSPYYSYHYDEALLHAYKALAGEWFLGFQMHEWASNLVSDWSRIVAEFGDFDETPTTEAIEAALHRNAPDQKTLLLECGTPAEFSTLKRPRTRQALLEQMDWLFALRQRQTGGFLLPADSYYMAIRQELRDGARALMPEIGAQISLTRMQIALTRGMARAAGVRWGVYYEPWGGVPFGCCFYKDTPENEWNVSGAATVHFHALGPTGGSSRALQNRLYYYSLLSGAEFMSEEWGTSNTFTSWKDYSLSEYGLHKQAFLSFVAQHRDLGDVITPIALVLPVDFTVFDLSYLRGDDTYLSFPLNDADEHRRFSHLRMVLKRILGDGSRRFGNEGHALCNSAWPDCFDIVYADTPTLKHYEVLIDLDTDSSLAALHPELADRILPSRDISALETALSRTLARLLPCKVDGDLSWMLNRDGDAFVLGLFNNEGVARSVAQGDVLLPEADTCAVIQAAGLLPKVLLGETAALQRVGDAWHYRLPAGQVALLRLATRN